jgi:outer membrane protein TolC
MSFPLTSGIVVPDYKENTVSFSMAQNLWKDAFGSASRELHEGLQLKAKAQDRAYKQSKAQYAMALINQYYSAWLAQQKLRSTLESHQRKQNLLKSTKIRLSRGTAEKPDLLQSEAVSLLSETNLAQVQAELDQKWRELIVNLNLPPAYLAFPASKVILDVSSKAVSWEKFCSSEMTEALEKAPSVDKARLDLLAAEKQKSAAISTQRAELQLRAQLESNGINSSMAESQTEAFANKNPSWAVGVVWKKPLGSSNEDVQALQASAHWIQAQAQYNTSLDDQKIALLQSCADWRDVEFNLPRLEFASKKQTERSRLEESRFRIGRSSTFQVIQAGDDATQSQLVHQQTQVAKELIHWRLMYLTGQLDSQLETWANE